MPEAVQTAYRSSTPEIQHKIRRVVEVWKTRNVFEGPIVQAIEARLDDIDKAKGTGGKKTLMGKSLFSSSSGTDMPKELESLAPLQVAVTKATIAARPSIDTAQTEYIKLNDPDAVLPSPPVYAARLSSLIKSLATAESSISESIKTRNALITDLQKILEINKSALAKDEETFMDLSSRKTSTEAKKREVEDSIMKGLALSENSPETPDGEGRNTRSGSAGFISEPPEVEELTPEPEERPTSVKHEIIDAPGEVGTAAVTDPASRVRSASSQSLTGISAKRRKLSHGQDNTIPDLGDMGMGNLEQDVATGGSALEDLDADVNELIRQESARM